MNKPKIHELAKELNVTSKRLMEKLAEIGIYPKSHMTTLEDDELEKLYKHIGVVNRAKNDAGASHADSESKLEPADMAARKSAPRIIRKTEVIIRDDTSIQEGKDKKEKRPLVRVSDSNDGLMAGFTRGNTKENSVISNVKKRTKPDTEEHREDTKPLLNAEHHTDRLIKPDDDILSIKKVSRPGKVENTAGNSDVKEQENMQKDSIIAEKPQVQNVKQEEKADKTEKAEKAEKVEKAVSKPEPSEKSEAVKAEKAPTSTEAASADKKIETVAEKKSTDEKSKEPVQAVKAPVEKPREAEAQGQQHGESRPREFGNHGQRQGGGQGGYQGQRQGDGRPQGGYQGQRQGGNQGGQGQRQGDYRSRDGHQGGNREGGYQGQRQGDFRPRDGAPREGGFRRDGQGGGYQGQRQGDRPYGNRPSYDKDGKPEFGGRRDDRGPGPNRGNRGLVIPKVATPTATEEKVFTRGERRTFQSVEKLKVEKKEQKKEAARSIPGGTEKGTNIKRKIDTLVGHKASVSDMYSDDFVIDVFYDDADEVINAKRAEKKLKKGKLEKEKYIPPKAVLTDITIDETVTVKELAEALKKSAAEIIKKLFLMGITATVNQELDFDTATIIADEYNVTVHKAVKVSQEEILFDESEDDPADLVPRPPVVVVMGHVDHGKTSLLDAIRSANIAEKEAGGITQHIGAYTVNLHGRDITFLDTPGHEAFTAMRARGAQVTDIAILVVAADDGVMPQTIEAINHAKAAGVSIIVAINKIDKPNANPDRVKQELTEHGLLIEEWGGDVIAVPVSAKKHENIDQLLEMVLLTADILELKANPKKQAKGTVIEAQLDKNRGPVATLLVQRGTLRIGDAILTGSTFGRIRSMVNDKGRKIKEAGPSIPVEIFGLSEVPEAGDTFYVVTDEKMAKQLAEKRKTERHEKSIGRAKISLDALFSQIQQGNVKELNLIVKADVQGSVEAIRQSMEKLSNDEVKVKVIHGAVGAVIEADVKLAEVSNAIIIGFNVRPAHNVIEMAQASGVEIKLYRIIYDAIDDIKNAMKGMLAPTFKEVVDGHAEVRQLFKVSNVGTIGGCYVVDGKILRNSDVRVVRDGIVIYEGKLASLKRFKDDAREVAAGYECGLMIERFNDIKEGDVIESFHMEEVQRQ